MAMQFSVTGKQVDVGDALSQHIEQSVGNLVGKGRSVGQNTIICLPPSKVVEHRRG